MPPTQPTLPMERGRLAEVAGPPGALRGPAHGERHVEGRDARLEPPLDPELERPPVGRDDERAHRLHGLAPPDGHVELGDVPSVRVQRVHRPRDLLLAPVDADLAGGPGREVQVNALLGYLVLDGEDGVEKHHALGRGAEVARVVGQDDLPQGHAHPVPLERLPDGDRPRRPREAHRAILALPGPPSVGVGHLLGALGGLVDHSVNPLHHRGDLIDDGAPRQSEREQDKENGDVEPCGDVGSSVHDDPPLRGRGKRWRNRSILPTGGGVAARRVGPAREADPPHDGRRWVPPSIWAPRRAQNAMMIPPSTLDVGTNGRRGA